MASPAEMLRSKRLPVKVFMQLLSKFCSHLTIKQLHEYTHSLVPDPDVYGISFDELPAAVRHFTETDPQQ